MSKTPQEIIIEDLEYIKNNVSGRLFNLNEFDLSKMTLDSIPNFTQEASDKLDIIQVNYKGNWSSWITKKELNYLQFLEASDRLRDRIEAGEFDSEVIRGWNVIGSKAERTKTALQLLARAFKM